MDKFEKDLLRILMFGLTGTIVSVILNIFIQQVAIIEFRSFSPIFGFVLGFSVTSIFISVGMLLTREKDVYRE